MDVFCVTVNKWLFYALLSPVVLGGLRGTVLLLREALGVRSPDRRRTRLR